MNYLAHIYLSGRDRQVQIGNFIGDAVKGNNYQAYSDKLQRGILLHRKIDDFSDHHAAVREAVMLGKPVFGRYSAVVTDIFFDYLLATHFQEYTGVKLSSLKWGFYTALVWNYRMLPSRFKGFLWHFILTDRLGQYTRVEGIRKSLDIMATYRGIQVVPTVAVNFLVVHENQLRSLFQDFLPDVKQMCDKELSY